MVYAKRKNRVKPPRVQLTDVLLKRLKDNNSGLTIPQVAKRTQLPYGLVYNIFYKRVRTVSARHYQMLFGEPAPRQVQLRVDGAYFRKMVRLWMYLNDDVTKASLYRAFFNDRNYKKVDYRLFSGKIGTVETELVRKMERKFFDCGIDKPTLEQWLKDLEQPNRQERISYGIIRPVLWYMKHKMGVHPTTLMNQFIDRYERGELKTVSRKIYDRVMDLKNRSENAINAGNKLGVERIKQEIYGEKKGYTLYAVIAEELYFLRKYARKSPKKYLGRSTYMYEKGGCKRIPSWRASKIFEDCERFIHRRMDLPLSCLPKSFQLKWLGRLRAVILARAADLLSNANGLVFEKKVLMPVHSGERYKNDNLGFTQFDRVSRSLGMRKAAFDLMVAQNCEIFRVVGRYTRRWYLSDLYIKELSENPYFQLITEKYERMVDTHSQCPSLSQCFHNVA